MKHADIRAALLPHARERMRAIEPDADLGNGTPLHEGTATILAACLARGGVKAFRNAKTTVDAVPDDVLREIVVAVRDLIGDVDSSKKVMLSIGVELQAGYRTGVTVGTNHYVPLRGRPGLHDFPNEEGLPTEPGSLMLRREVAKAMAMNRPMDVAPPRFDEIEVRRDYRTRDVLAVPMRGGPGVTYMEEDRIHPAETLLDIEIHLIARTAAAKARSLWDERDTIDQEYGRVMSEIGPVLEKAQAEGLPVRLAGVSVNRSFSQTRVTPLVEVIGNDLKPAMWKPDTSQGTTIHDATHRQMAVQRRRKRIMDEAGESGARGRIDRITLAAIRGYADDPAEVLRRIGRSRRLTIRGGRAERTHLGGRPLPERNPLRITWRNGRVGSSFEFTKDITWQNGTLVLKKASFPQTVIDLLPGKPITALIDHPFLTADDRIRSVRVVDKEDGFKYFNVDTSWTTFDAETGIAAD
jgi:hypothetical protein